MKILNELKNDAETRCFFFWFGLLVTAIGFGLAAIATSLIFFLPKLLTLVLCFAMVCPFLGFVFACLITHDTRESETREEVGAVLLVCTFYPITWLYIVVSAIFPLFNNFMYCLKSMRDTVMYVIEGKTDE